MTYDELVSLANAMPRIPRRELKCHPAVIIALRAQYPEPVDVVTVLGFASLPQNLLDIPVYVDLTLGWGEWFLKEDGLTVASGNILA